MLSASFVSSVKWVVCEFVISKRRIVCEFVWRAVCEATRTLFCFVLYRTCSSPVVALSTVRMCIRSGPVRCGLDHPIPAPRRDKFKRHWPYQTDRTGPTTTTAPQPCRQVWLVRSSGAVLFSLLSRWRHPRLNLGPVKETVFCVVFERGFEQLLSTCFAAVTSCAHKSFSQLTPEQFSGTKFKKKHRICTELVTILEDVRTILSATPCGRSHMR